MISGRQLCSFFVHGLLMGIDVQYVQEAVRNIEITGVPLAPISVLGLINLRNQIITAIDLRRCLGLPKRAAEQMSVHLILRMEDESVSLLVDEVDGAIEPDEHLLEIAPAALRERFQDLVHEAYKLPGGLLFVLDLHRLLATISADAVPTSRLKSYRADAAALLDSGAGRRGLSE
jgi:purine-binding chemotaxis protein CheW